MAAAAAAKTDAAAGEEAPKAKGGKKKLLLILIPVLLIGLGAGLWFSGILPGLLGMNPPPVEQAAEGEEAAEPAPPPRSPPAFVELPEMIANLNAPGRRPVFVRLRAKLEISKAEDAAAVTEAMPRLVDLFQTYLREVRPEELRGSAGTHRLREELMARASLAATPARITDVLFMEMLVQ
ncbi:flagellar basal body-associated FliL family protein [Falsiroseomonas selenitidurans]|uniref:Flagellar protein FliL n=1 Tax=Falsiroseomonas selenitidurans TaxID=2716335 RepID=A0ABX1DZZ6_9PROT|nr:flagellar basal body-associated FliL family protein [Falsiroseomonas selenitidurans]NKC29955.1 flagellar basal body protein FliL [Falsiroseomonas selenitidurans]